MDEKSTRHTVRWVVASGAVFVLFFLVGFLSGIPNLFVVPLLVFGALGAVHVIKARRAAPGKLRTNLTVMGYASVAFTLAVLYGTVGIWGYYEIYDPLYVGSVILAAVVFLTSMIRSLTILRRRMRGESAEVGP